MRYPSLRSLLWRLAPIPVTLGGLLALSLPQAVATTRVTTRDYETCVATLLAAEVVAASATQACAASLYPQNLAACVAEIDDNTAISGVAALASCRRVRRPVELATCVTSIVDGGVEGEASLRVLEGCRRSLLPVRFSSCVVGLRQSVELSVDNAMNTCIAAGDRPRNVLPNFIPGDPLPPLIAPQ